MVSQLRSISKLSSRKRKANTMAEILFSPQARIDLSDIWDFTIERWGIEQAERYTSEINGEISTLAEFPNRGPTCDDIRLSYRKLLIAKHVVYYQAEDSFVIVIRILHQSMDPDSIL